MTANESEGPVIERESWSREHPSGGWEDAKGFVGPFPVGVGPRNSPVGAFPTGPEVGERLPDVVATAHTGETVDVHAARSGGPAVVVFYRSAVW